MAQQPVDIYAIRPDLSRPTTTTTAAAANNNKIFVDRDAARRPLYSHPSAYSLSTAAHPEPVYASDTAYTSYAQPHLQHHHQQQQQPQPHPQPSHQSLYDAHRRYDPPPRHDPRHDLLPLQPPPSRRQRTLSIDGLRSHPGPAISIDSRSRGRSRAVPPISPLQRSFSTNRHRDVGLGAITPEGIPIPRRRSSLASVTRRAQVISLSEAWNIALQEDQGAFAIDDDYDDEYDDDYDVDDGQSDISYDRHYQQNHQQQQHHQQHYHQHYQNQLQSHTQQHPHPRYPHLLRPLSPAVSASVAAMEQSAASRHWDNRSHETQENGQTKSNSSSLRQVPSNDHVSATSSSKLRSLQDLKDKTRSKLSKSPSFTRGLKRTGSRSSFHSFISDDGKSQTQPQVQVQGQSLSQSQVLLGTKSSRLFNKLGLSREPSSGSSSKKDAKDKEPPLPSPSLSSSKSKNFLKRFVSRGDKDKEKDKGISSHNHGHGLSHSFHGSLSQSHHGSLSHSYHGSTDVARSKESLAPPITPITATAPVSAAAAEPRFQPPVLVTPPARPASTLGHGLSHSRSYSGRSLASSAQSWHMDDDMSIMALQAQNSQPQNSQPQNSQPQNSQPQNSQPQPQSSQPQSLQPQNSHAHQVERPPSLQPESPHMRVASPAAIVSPIPRRAVSMYEAPEVPRNGRASAPPPREDRSTMRFNANNNGSNTLLDEIRAREKEIETINGDGNEYLHHHVLTTTTTIIRPTDNRSAMDADGVSIRSTDRRTREMDSMSVRSKSRSRTRSMTRVRSPDRGLDSRRMRSPDRGMGAPAGFVPVRELSEPEDNVPETGTQQQPPQQRPRSMSYSSKRRRAPTIDTVAASAGPPPAMASPRDRKLFDASAHTPPHMQTDKRAGGAVTPITPAFDVPPTPPPKDTPPEQLGVAGAKKAKMAFQYKTPDSGKYYHHDHRYADSIMEEDESAMEDSMIMEDSLLLPSRSIMEERERERDGNGNGDGAGAEAGAQVEAEAEAEVDSIPADDSFQAEENGADDSEHAVLEDSIILEDTKPESSARPTKPYASRDSFHFTPHSHSPTTLPPIPGSPESPKNKNKRDAGPGGFMAPAPLSFDAVSLSRKHKKKRSVSSSSSAAALLAQTLAQFERRPAAAVAAAAAAYAHPGRGLQRSSSMRSAERPEAGQDRSAGSVSAPALVSLEPAAPIAAAANAPGLNAPAEIKSALKRRSSSKSSRQRRAILAGISDDEWDSEFEADPETQKQKRAQQKAEQAAREAEKEAQQVEKEAREAEIEARQAEIKAQKQSLEAAAAATEKMHARAISPPPAPAPAPVADRERSKSRSRTRSSEPSSAATAAYLAPSPIPDVPSKELLRTASRSNSVASSSRARSLSRRRSGEVQQQQQQQQQQRAPSPKLSVTDSAKFVGVDNVKKGQAEETETETETEVEEEGTEVEETEAEETEEVPIEIPRPPAISKPEPRPRPQSRLPVPFPPPTNSAKPISFKQDMYEIRRRYNLDDSTTSSDDFALMVEQQLAGDGKMRRNSLGGETQRNIDACTAALQSIRMAKQGITKLHDEVNRMERKAGRAVETGRAVDAGRSVDTGRAVGVVRESAAKKNVPTDHHDDSDEETKTLIPSDYTDDKLGASMAWSTQTLFDSDTLARRRGRPGAVPQAPILAPAPAPVPALSLRRRASSASVDIVSIDVPLPRVYTRQPTFRLTFVGVIMLVAALWYASETAVCQTYCRPMTCAEPCMWEQDDPTFGFAIPVKLDQWATGGAGRALLARAAEDLDDGLADVLDWLHGRDVRDVDVATLSHAGHKQLRRRLRKKGLSKKLVDTPEQLAKYEEWGRIRRVVEAEVERERQQYYSARG